MSGFPYEGCSSESPLISVESTNEWQIYDILYDGQERYLQPLTFSDHVSKLAHLVDWMKLQQDENGETSDVTGEDAKAVQKTGIGPWEGVSKQLHLALTEMNVLLDLINVAMTGKYMVFDPVSHDPSDENRSGGKADAYTLVSKRKSLCLASSVLLDFVERQKQKLGVQQSQNDEQSFFRELTNLRRGWRLKKTGDVIYGDLSYRSFGPKFRPNATFEVHKKQTKNDTQNMTTGTGAINGGCSSLIDLVIPHDLAEECVLKVFIFDESCSVPIEMLTSLDKSSFRSNIRNSCKEVYMWQERLEKAQKTLYHKDMFSEAIRLLFQSSTSCHSLFVLEHSLSQLYCKGIESSCEAVIMRPVSTPLTTQSKRLRLAGPEAMNVRQICDFEDDRLLLEQIIDQASHYLLLQKTKAALEEFAARCIEPTISVYWTPETSKYVSLARIHMMTPFYEFCSKAMISLEVHVKTLRVTMKDGETTEITENVDELISLLEAQVSAMIFIKRYMCYVGKPCSAIRIRG
ncbi:unnamed protein product [Soboliphyme baturini]|uniref:Mediator complex subunit 17 n=1 Tax=Soboliphyme baturini TaxID=241478 RepID=A0A183I8Z0_9BILA|nr:unnamed protein product [Soboliphyme baturini]